MNLFFIRSLSPQSEWRDDNSVLGQQVRARRLTVSIKDRAPLAF
jgi:hypothetical protein